MRPLLLIIAFIAVVVGLSVAFPDRLFNPGPLMTAHAGLEKDCLACHKPFGGAGAVQCTDCHKPDAIGIRTVRGGLLPVRKGEVPFHRGVPETSCLDCHTDHKGRDAKRAIRSFRHETLDPKLLGDCSACHSGDRPQDPLHERAGRNCADCHGTGAWKGVRFDHGKLDAKLSARCLDCHKGDRPGDRLHAGASSSNCAACHGTKAWNPANFDHKSFAAGRQCVACHKGDRPGDRLHAGASSSNCAACHGTKAWKPARFDHAGYFRLDGAHRAACSTCHTDPADYRKYTCYGCHEHTRSNIAAEHLREGIRNYQDCARCHRSGDDDG